jgi:hypothetical protein
MQQGVVGDWEIKQGGLFSALVCFLFGDGDSELSQKHIDMNVSAT